MIEMDIEYDLLEQVRCMNENLKKCSRENMTGCIDWFTCTFDMYWYEPDNDFMRIRFDSSSVYKMKKLLAFFGKPNVDINTLDFERGGLGYRGRIELYEGVYLLIYGPSCINGCPATTLNVTGKGCNDMIKRDLKNFMDLIRFCLQHGYKFTRLDLAIDNFTTIFPLEKIMKHVLEESYTSVSSKGFELIGKPNKKSKYGYDGLTLYLGHSKKVKSDLELRIYAKNYEQGVEEEIPNWVRWELQLGDHARIKQVLILLLIAFEQNNFFDWFLFVAGIMREVVEFKILGMDSNKSRWKIDPEYLEFLDNVKGVKLFASPSDKTSFDKSLDWFKRSCSLFLTQLFFIYGEAKLNRFLKYLILNKYEDLKTKDYNFIENACLDLGFNYDEREGIRAIQKLLKEVNIKEFDDSIRIAEGAILKEDEKDEE